MQPTSRVPRTRVVAFNFSVGLVVLRSSLIITILDPSGVDKLVPTLADTDTSSSGRSLVFFMGVFITSVTDKLSECASGF